MNMANSIPLHIISGFLGSGKTTFLREVLGHISGTSRVGVIQNEFAAVSADRYALADTGSRFELLEINNGSLFCVCLLGEFISSLDTFLDRYDPEVLVLEASGLSDTTSLTGMFSGTSLEGRVHVAANWCILDAAGFARTGRMMPRVVHQLRMADIILVNKSDLAGAHTGEAVAYAQKNNPFAEIIPTTYCRVPFKEQLLRKPHYFPATAALARPSLTSAVLKSSRPFREELLESFLKEWSPRAYRIKGFARVSGGGSIAVQCTPEQTTLLPASHAPGITELIAMTDQFTFEEWDDAFRRCLV